MLFIVYLSAGIINFFDELDIKYYWEVIEVSDETHTTYIRGNTV